MIFELYLLNDNEFAGTAPFYPCGYCTKNVPNMNVEATDIDFKFTHDFQRDSEGLTQICGRHAFHFSG